MSVQVNFVGNLTADPELKFTNAGIAVVSFTVATSKRVKDGDGWKDGPTSFVRCTAWRQYAENVAESLAKGTRVMVSGTMQQREYETPQGEKRSTWDCDVTDVGPVLRYATATVRRVERQQTGGGFGEYQAAKADLDDPWANPQQADEIPF